MLGLGFGFVEVGTLTPRPQAGNPQAAPVPAGRGPGGDQPHGLQQWRAGRGAARGSQRATGARRRRRQYRRQQGQRATAIADYVAGRARRWRRSPTISPSTSRSPNTPGLRALQDEGALDDLLAAVDGARAAAGRRSSSRSRPTSATATSTRIARAAIDHGIDALIVANTTVIAAAAQVALSRRGGRPVGRAAEAAGARRAARFPRATGGALPLIAVGGIASGDDAWDRIRAGASLVQLYTALVYRRARASPRRIARELAARLRARRLRQHCRGGRDRVARPRCVISDSSSLRRRSPLAACAPAAQSAARRRSAHRPGMVCAADPRAAEAGVEILRAGRQRRRRGARDDARADRGRAAKLGHRRRRLPRLSRRAAAGSTRIDGRETAPAAATAGCFLGRRQAAGRSTRRFPGGMSVGVPGNIRLMALAHARARQAALGAAVRARDPARPRRLRDHPAARIALLGGDDGRASAR